MFSDGDLRRAIETGHDLRDRQIRDLMICGWCDDRARALRDGYACHAGQTDHAIVVVDNDYQRSTNMHDLLQAGLHERENRSAHGI